MYYELNDEVHVDDIQLIFIRLVRFSELMTKVYLCIVCVLSLENESDRETIG